MQQAPGLTLMAHRGESYIYQLITILLYAFRDAGFPAVGKGPEVECPVSARKAPVGDFFTKHKGVWVLNSDSLPSDFSIKSIAVSRKAIMVETAPVAWPAYGRAAQDWSGGAFFAMPARRQVLAHDGRTVLAVISDICQPPYKHGLGQPAPRVMWTILFSLPQDLLDEAARAVDVAYHQVGALMVPDEGEDVSGSSGSQSMKPKFKLDTSLRPMLEQTPHLSLEMRTTQELQFAMLCQQARHLARMPEETAMNFVQDVAQSLGTSAAFNLLLTSLSQRVKDANPGITWKQARTASRRMLAKIAM